MTAADQPLVPPSAAAHRADSPRGILMIFGTGVIWGTIAVAAKLSYIDSTLTPLSVTWLRTIVASIACLAIMAPTLRRDLRAAGRNGILIMVLIGLGLAVSQVCYLEAVNRLGITAATLIALCVPPVMIASISVAFTEETMNRTLAIALIGSLLGTALLVGVPDDALRVPTSTLIAGVLFGLASAVGVTIHYIGGRRIAGDVPSMLPLTIAFPVGVFVLTPLVIASGFSWHQPAMSWFWAIYLGLVPSVIAYLLFQRGLQGVKASTASIITLVEPLTAAILAAALFGERLSPIGWIGGAMLLGSIVLLSLRREPIPISD